MKTHDLTVIHAGTTSRGPSRSYYRATCSCGWEGVDVWTPLAAEQHFSSHLYALDNPGRDRYFTKHGKEILDHGHDPTRHPTDG